MCNVVHFLYLNDRLQYIDVGDNRKPRAVYYNLEVKVAHAAERHDPTTTCWPAKFVLIDILLRYFRFDTEGKVLFVELKFNAF